MHPTDPAHVSHMVSALRRELGPDAAVCPSARTPASGGVAVQIRSHGVTLWLHCWRTPVTGTYRTLGGQLRYGVRDADGRALDVYASPGESELVAAAYRIANRCRDPLAQQLAHDARTAKEMVAA